MLHTEYQGSRLSGFRQYFCFIFPYISICGALLTQEAYFEQNLAEAHWVMLHTKYQSSRPCGFREEEFLKFLS